MAIEYERVNWDTTKYVNPTNMNQMDAGIKAACDGVDENSSAITAINSTLSNLTEQHLVSIGTNCYARRIGNIVHIFSTGWSKPSSLPNGYRPADTHYYVVGTQTNTTSFNRINSSGVFETTDRNEIFSTCFVTNNPMPQS